MINFASRIKNLPIKLLIKEYITQPRNVIFLLLFGAFILTRKETILIFLVCFYATTTAYLLYSRKILSFLTIKIIAFIVGLLVVAFFLYASYLYIRFESWDGLLWYIKHTILLQDKKHLETIYLPYAPYLVEIFLGSLLKHTNFNIVSLALTVVGLIDILLIYLVSI